MGKDYLLKLGEISLKGLNRKDFERRLAANIKQKLGHGLSSMRMRKGRISLTVDGDVPDDLAERALSTTFGISSYARCHSCAKDMDLIRDLAGRVMLESGFRDDGSSFKVDARREDKGFALSSAQIERDLADVVHGSFPSMKVNLRKPDHTLFVEIRDKAYVFASSRPSPGGLPVGSSGKALCLLSGGIDSPVAAWMAASRGLRLELLYFHAYPYVGDEALEKVETLAGILAPYLNGTILHIVDFAPMERLIEAGVHEREKTLMLRAAMIRVAQRIASRRRCGAIVTGESLAQVASQTLEALDFTTSMTDCLVLRPLVGMDKEAITSTAKRIGTYETSILPYSDCCSLFSPAHPMTRPNRARESAHYFALEGVEKAESEADSAASAVSYGAMGDKRQGD